MDNIKTLEEEIRLMAYYNMRNHIGAMALRDEDDKFYHLLYAGMKKDHGEKLPPSLINTWSSK